MVVTKSSAIPTSIVQKYNPDMNPIIMDKQILDRFWSKIQKTDSCWEWTSTKINNGYGEFGFNGRMFLAHRISYILTKGSIPDGLTLDHLCRNRSCVNPDHLEPVTLKENILRGEGQPAINARKTHCIQGHEFTPENTYKNKSERQCKICREKYAKKYKPLHRKEANDYRKRYYQKNKA